VTVKVGNMVAGFRPRNALLFLPAAVCFLQAAQTPWGADPGPVITGVMGLFLVTRAIAAAPMPIPVVVSGYILAAVMVAADRGFLKEHVAFWLLVMLVGFACFGWWGKIEKLWKR
jgi:hypothetical protein